MVVRGVYTEAEGKMIAQFNKDADKWQGWVKNLPRQGVISRAIILIKREEKH